VYVVERVTLEYENLGPSILARPIDGVVHVLLSVNEVSRLTDLESFVYIGAGRHLASLAIYRSIDVVNPYTLRLVFAGMIKHDAHY
jgi:hypothetical protein